MSAAGAPVTVAVLAVGGNVSQGILKALRRSPLPLRILGTDVSADQARSEERRVGKECS